MVKRFFLVAAVLLSAVILGCNETDEPPQEPGAISLDHKNIVIGVGPNDVGKCLAIYYDIPVGGVNDTLRILSGNGNYGITKVPNNFTGNFRPRVQTEAKIVGDSLVVINIKAPTKEEVEKESPWILYCRDRFVLSDSKGKSEEIEIFCLPVEGELPW